MPGDLLIFGDSWAYGAELDPSIRETVAFGYCLGRMLGVDQTLNFSEPGSSISHLNLQLNTAIDCRADQLHNAIAVFFLTGQERFMLFDYRGDFVHLGGIGPSIRPIQQDQRSQIEKINEFYYKNIHSYTADRINLNINLLALQARCRYYGINDYYISGWQALDLWPEVSTNKIYAQGQRHCADIFGMTSTEIDAFKYNQYVIPNQGHPNEQGHHLIAQELYKLITGTA